MIPIYEQRNGRGVGYSYARFSERFDQICRQHLRDKRATAFAFIFYDFHSPLREMLKDRDVFTQLDRLTGRDLSIFFLDAPQDAQTTSRFTREFADALGLEEKLALPCIVFFQVRKDKATNIVVSELPEHETIAYNRLYRFIEDYIADAPSVSEAAVSQGDGGFHWFKAASRFVSIEVFKDIIEAIVQHVAR